MSVYKTRNTDLRPDADLFRHSFSIVRSLVRYFVKLDLGIPVPIDRWIIVPHVQRSLASVKAAVA